MDVTDGEAKMGDSTAGSNRQPKSSHPTQRLPNLAKAIRYTLGHWTGLCVFLTDVRGEVDSSTVGRNIWPI
jgi:hypothetical protein